jgi:hypothetical protein
MMVQMGRNLKRTPKVICVFFAVIGLGLLLLSCASNSSQSADHANYHLADSELTNADIETLKNIWLKSDNLNDRNRIVLEFENRKSVDGLQFCLLWATLAHSGRSSVEWPNSARRKAYASKARYSIKESIGIINALGETKSEEAIDPLTHAIRRFHDKKIIIAVLQAFSKIGSPKAVSPTAEILTYQDPHLRILALDTLGQIKASKSLQVILPALYDTDARIRCGRLSMPLEKLEIQRRLTISVSYWTIRTSPLEPFQKSP